jgi:hypothetical protein
MLRNLPRLNAKSLVDLSEESDLSETESVAAARRLQLRVAG